MEARGYCTVEGKSVANQKSSSTVDGVSASRFFLALLRIALTHSLEHGTLHGAVFVVIRPPPRFTSSPYHTSPKPARLFALLSVSRVQVCKCTSVKKRSTGSTTKRCTVTANTNTNVSTATRRSTYSSVPATLTHPTL